MSKWTSTYRGLVDIGDHLIGEEAHRFEDDAISAEAVHLEPAGWSCPELADTIEAPGASLMAERKKYAVGGISPDIAKLAILERPEEHVASQGASVVKVGAVHGAQTNRIDEDFHAWLLDQASLLRSQQYQLLDWNNLAEELEAMAGAQRRELLDRLATVYEHFLKLERQPDPRRERNRKITIVKTRTAIESLLELSPGLKGQLEELATRAYVNGRKYAGTELGLSRRQWEKELPETSPWTLEEILDDDFFPSAVSKNG